MTNRQREINAGEKAARILNIKGLLYMLKPGQPRHPVDAIKAMGWLTKGAN